MRDKIIMGGAPINSAFVQHVGADGSVEDCVEAVKIADQLLEKKKL